MKSQIPRLSLVLVLLSTASSYFAYSCSPDLPKSWSPLSSTPQVSPRPVIDVKPFCYGSAISICSFPGQYGLAEAVDLVQHHVELHNSNISAKESTHKFPYVACAEVSYPGREPEVISEAHKRGTFICLFNSKYAMNMSLNRISTFVEDFFIADDEPGYSDEKWAEAQITEGTLGHNLESPDIRNYLTQTKNHIEKRRVVKNSGTALESEFLHSYIVPKIDPYQGKPESIFLGVYIPSRNPSPDTADALKAVLGHEIFHGLYFHSSKMRQIVGEFIDKLDDEEKKLIEKRLSQKGYAVSPKPGETPSQKQIYMLYNEAQAYLLESGSCNDGAFVSYLDEDAESPHQVIPHTAPLVVKHAASLRQRLIETGVFTQDWAHYWSPDVVQQMGCKAQ